MTSKITTPGKVNAFATKVNREEDKSRLNTCSGVVLWNDDSGTRHESDIHCSVVNGKLTITLDGKAVATSGTAPQQKTEMNPEIIDLWNQFQEARNKRQKTAEIIEQLDQLFNQ